RFCAPHAMGAPRGGAAPGPGYEKGGRIAHCAPAASTPATIASNSARIVSRLPCIFQLPATSRVRAMRVNFTASHYASRTLRLTQAPENPAHPGEVAEWGDATVCNAVHVGSNPTFASKLFPVN